VVWFILYIQSCLILYTLWSLSSLYFAILISSLFFILTAPLVPVAQLSRFWQNGARPVPAAVGLTSQPHRPMANLITGQIEALLPDLIAAMAIHQAAAKNVADLKLQMRGIIKTPQTVKTVWGSVTLKNGSRTVKVISKLLSNKISLMKEEGIASGDSIENFGDMVISVSKTDR